MQKLVPSLWFDKEADEAIESYFSVFNSAPHSKNDSKVVSIERYPQDKQIGPEPGMGGKVLTAIFELAGQRFEACGWLKDKYGLSWQIVPKQLGEMLSDPDRERAGRVMDAMLQMKKIDIGGLRRAYDGS